MDIVVSVAGKIAELTVEPIGRQVGYLLCYRNNINELKDKVDELETSKVRIEHQVEAERRNGRETESDVLRWQTKVIETLQEAKQLCEDPRHATVGCSKWSFPNLKERHQLSRKATKMAKAIDEMKGKTFDDGVGYVPPSDITNSISTTTGSDKLESRNLVKEKVVSSLKDPKVSKIGVYGISGVGKTTLVKEVAKQVKGDKLFDTVVMVTVSQTTDLERIQNEIADQLGLSLEGMTSPFARANRLSERIRKEKTILIILDDLWEKIDLEKLGIPSVDIWGKNNSEKLGDPLKDDYKGCKLLLTSRTPDVLQKNDTQNNLSLQVLTNVESWNLFETMVGDVVKDANLQTIATQVAQRCAGLPILIVTMAKSLKDKNIHSWRDALNNLKSVDSRDMQETIFSALQFNLNRLEAEVKEVFLLCGVNGTSVLVSDVLKYAIGLGVLKNINTIEDARNRLYRIIDELKACCLLLDEDASEGVIKMHDIFYEVVVSIASRDQYAFTKKRNAQLQDWPSKDFLGRCTQIILKQCFIQKLPEMLDCPNLKFLHLNSKDNPTLEIPNSFFGRMGNLEAIDLTGMIISSLPMSLVSLTKLKTLCLDQCTLKNMTGIGALINLEILSFISSSIEVFPSEIGQLTRLRMLDLSKSGIEIIPPNILSKLTRVEELYMSNASIRWEVDSSTNKQNKIASLAELEHLTCLTTLEIQIREAWILPRNIMFEKLERYRVVIGDEWDWLDSKGTSRLLKLKLDTSIHLELGIKALIFRAEELYLDKISGISDVLFQLNGDGFPLLKHLHIQNNDEILHIINSMERNNTHNLFPRLETIILHNLVNLVEICHGSLPVDSFSKLRVIKVISCGRLVYLFSALMVKALSELREIEVSECSSMKAIVFVENADSGITNDDKIEFSSLRSLSLCHLPVIDDFCSNKLTSYLTTVQNMSRTNVLTSVFNGKVNFSCLETLKLSSINLKKIWDDDHFFESNSIHNLVKLSVEDCSGLEYLFSSSMIGSFLNLNQLEISKCQKMEEIITTKGRNGIVSEEVRLSKLETVIIKNMKSLKKVWHLEFDGLRSLEVNNCETLENIFPSAMHRTFGSLETLKVSNCGGMKEIFEIHSEKDIVAQVTQLKKLHLLNLPKLKQIWGKDPQGSIRFHNLQDVYVEDCENIEYLFPFSIAVDLLQLEKLKVDSCGMTEIVARKEGPMEENVIFQFHQLDSLVIWRMNKLMRFYAGNHSLTCPSLRELWVFDCPKLKLLRSRSTSNQRKSADAQTQVSKQQPLLIIEEVIPNLEKWTLNNEEATMILQDPQWKDHYLRKLNVLRLSYFEDKVTATFLDSIVQKAPNLKYLVVEQSSLKEIFYDERVVYPEDKIKHSTQLKNLELYSNQQLQHICREGCQIDPILEVLDALFVEDCASLKILVPSSITFSYLTYLQIAKCNGLINLIYSSTARSLGKLESMKIKECNSLKEIVTQEVNDAKDEIVVFSSLGTIELECLPRLHSFSSSTCFFKFPLLRQVVVRECPKMKMFCARETSTPMLRKVIIEGKDKEWCWEGDLNGTIEKMFADKVAFHSLKHLELSQYPELRELWYSPFPQQVFDNLKSLVVQKCDFLSDMLLSLNLLQSLSNLEELQVSDCDSLEFVFDLTNMNQKQMLAKDIIHLKTITLSSLPKLKHIWKQHSQEIVSFDTIGEFSSDTFQELKISKIEGSEKTHGEEDEAYMHRHRQPASLVEQIQLSQLETIRINSMKSLKKVWHLEFDGLKSLEVNNCETLENIFPSAMHRTFGSLETLKVSNCGGMKEIFEIHSEKDIVAQVTQLKKLHLLNLPKLKQIWGKDPQGSIRFHNLQDVYVEDCENIEYLFPFSIAVDLLQLEKLKVDSCGMTEIVARKEGPMEENVIFQFHQLDSLVIWRMNKLMRFYAGNHSLTCPSLRELWVFDCPKLKLLRSRSTSNQRKSADAQTQVSKQQPLLIIEEVIPNLEKWTLNNEEATMILQDPQWKDHYLRKLDVLRLSNFEDKVTATFLDSIVQKAPNLKYLVIEQSSLKEIFYEERVAYPEDKIKHSTQLKNLELYSNQQLQHICREGCQIDPILEVLDALFVEDCASLKILVPSSITFSYLTYLQIAKCNGLINLIYSSTARSLGKLESIKIKECNSLKEIVTQEVNGAKDEIVVFSSLGTIELECLPRLHSFSSSTCFFKFPLLRQVVVRECPKMKMFCARETSTPMLRKVITEGKDKEWCWEGDLNGTIEKMFADKVAFHSLKHLELSQYPELRELWYSPFPQQVFDNLKSLVVQKCDFLSDMLLSLNLLQSLSNLEELQVSECDSLESVFDLTNMNQKQMLAKEIIHLKTITLSSLPELKHIWKRHFQDVVSFDNSGETSSDDCQGLKMSKIQGLSETREEDEGDIEHQQPAPSIEQVLFRSLETIIIKDMPELKTLWHPFFTSNSISNLKTMEVSDCEKLENIFPSYMERAFASLETLMVTDCNSIQVIFDFSSEMGSAEDTTSLQTLTLLRLSKPKQIWSRDPQANIGFHNLKHVCVEDCENLEYLLPFSIAMHAIQLEDVTIKDVGRMRQIVSNKEGPVDSPVKFEFNHLTSLVLSNLHELEGFFAGNHCLSCPSLRELDVYNCVRLKLFKMRCSNSQRTVSDDKLQKSMQQPLFTLEEVLGNLETLALNSEDASMILQGQFSGEQLGKLKILYLTKFEDEPATFPYWFLQNLKSLNHLIVEWSSFREIFQNEIPTHEKQKFETRMRLKKLTLGDLYQLQHICKEGFQIDPVLEILEYLKVDKCSNLKHLAPSSVNFSHLADLEVQNCSGLTHLITSTTARSLVKLTTMKIGDCNSLEHVVAEGREEAEDEIAFSSLEILELACLPVIKSFCSTNCVLNIPLLEKVVVKQCPRMKIFSTRDTWTPTLEKVLTDEEDEEWCWEGDLNVTVKKIFQDTAIGEGDEGDSEESSRNIPGISGASSCEEQAGQSKGSKIVDTGKQEIQRLPSSSADRQQGKNALSTDPLDVLSPPTFQDAEQSNHSEIHPSGNSISITTASTMANNKETAETQEMNKVNEKPLVQLAQNKLSLTANEDAATGTQEMDENMDRPLFEAAQNALNSSISQDTEESRDSKTHPSQNLFSQTTSFVIDDKNETIGTREMQEAFDRTSIQTDQNAVSLTTAQNTDIETKEMYATIERPLDQPPQSKLSIPTATGPQGMDNNNERPLVEAAQSPAREQDTEEPHDSKTCPGENLVNTTTSVIGNKKETIEAQDMYETIDRPLIPIDRDGVSLATIQNTALQTQEKYEDTGKPLVQATQGKVRPREIQDTEESRNLDIGTQDKLGLTMVNYAGFDDISVIEPKILSGENLLNQTTNFVTIENRATIDPSPSQPLDTLTSSILASDAYSRYKGMIDITLQNMPYLEAGVKQHPQVLDWLNTKRRRVFASSFFSLFAEVTRLLRTTRRGDLTEDDQNYIKECCTALQGVGFDESWICHVYRCIEQCGDGEELKRKVGEAEGQASNLKAQLESIKNELASVEASLVLLRDKASKLDDFVDS